MTEELGWSRSKQKQEWEDSVKYLLTMGLPAIRENITRKEVESGVSSKFMSKQDYALYSRSEGPDGLDVEPGLKTANQSPEMEKARAEQSRDSKH